MSNIKALIFSMILIFSAEAAHKTVGLNMIVKDESAVIERCLKSVLPIVDYWVIVDTGSSDDTKEKIKAVMKNCPGELYSRPWVNFEHNRNEALELIKGHSDYVLFIDADEQLVYSDGFSLPPLDQDVYFIMAQNMGTKYYRVGIVNNEKDWVWVGVVHEALFCKQPATSAILEGVANLISWDGARSNDPDKYRKDAELLEEALAKDPTNARYVYYLAQSYRDAGLFTRAYEAYSQRAEMKGGDEEVFSSLLEKAKIQDRLEMPDSVVIEGYYQAFYNRPSRVEPLFYLARHHCFSGNYELAFPILKRALSIPQPNDMLCLEAWIYDYALLNLWAECTFQLGRYQESYDALTTLAAKPYLPPEVREGVNSNLSCFKAQ